MNPLIKLDQSTLLKILDNSFDEIFVTDANGIVIYVNSVCERHYGLNSAQVLGRKAASLVKEGYYSPPIIHQVLETKQQVNLVQKTNLGKTLLVTATPVFKQNGELDIVVQNARDITQLEVIKHELDKANRLIREYREDICPQLDSDVGTYGLVGQSPRFKELMSFAAKVAPIDATVILLGESGVGKGLLAKYIHEMSERSKGPFVTINCAAIPEDLIESELFGYVGGAFTGAHQKGRRGRLELAYGGTLLLDEIAEMPFHLQAKLLEVVQDRQFMPIGGRKIKSLDIRIICATNRDLHAMVANGSFRSDLYHRLKVIEMEVPPLRERIEDILPLAYFYLNQFDKQFGKTHILLGKTGSLLLSYPWPGNIRELMHTMELLAATVDNVDISPEDLPVSIFQLPSNKAEPGSRHSGLEDAREALTRQMILDAYLRLRSSYKIAGFLNISQSKAHRLIRRYVGVSHPPPKP